MNSYCWPPNDPPPFPPYLPIAPLHAPPPIPGCTLQSKHLAIRIRLAYTFCRSCTPLPGLRVLLSLPLHIYELLLSRPQPPEREKKFFSFERFLVIARHFAPLRDESRPVTAKHAPQPFHLPHRHSRTRPGRQNARQYALIRPDTTRDDLARPQTLLRVPLHHGFVLPTSSDPSSSRQFRPVARLPNLTLVRGCSQSLGSDPLQEEQILESRPPDSGSGRVAIEQRRRDNMSDETRSIRPGARAAR